MGVAFDFLRREDRCRGIDVYIRPTRTREPRWPPSRWCNVPGCGHRRCWSHCETDFGTATEVPSETFILLSWRYGSRSSRRPHPRRQVNLSRTSQVPRCYIRGDRARGCAWRRYADLSGTRRWHSQLLSLLRLTFFFSPLASRYCVVLFFFSALMCSISLEVSISVPPEGGVKLDTSSKIASSTITLSNLTVCFVFMGSVAPGMVILLAESS